jgi:hypothetical protein
LRVVRDYVSGWSFGRYRNQNVVGGGLVTVVVRCPGGWSRIKFAEVDRLVIRGINAHATLQSRLEVDNAH